MNIQTLIKSFATLLNGLIGIMASLAVVVFIWGLVIFIFKSGDETSHKEGKNRMVWGVIALFVMISVCGIVHFISVDLLGQTVTVRHLDFNGNDNSPNPCGTEPDGSPIPCGGNDQNP